MQDHSIAGINILIRGPRSPVTDAVLEMFRLSHATDLPDKVGIAIFDLHASDNLEGVLPAWLCQKLARLTPSKEVLMLYGPSNELAAVINNGSAWQCAWVEIQGHEIRYVSCKKADGRTPLSVSTVLVPILRDLLAARNKLLLHAAAVRCPNGCGILILADSGGGKTTTALSTLRQGSGFLADDLVVLQEVGQDIQITGFPELLNLSEQTVGFFPEIKEHFDFSTQIPASAKRRISAQTVYGAEYMLETCHLHAIFFVQIEPDGPKTKLTNPGQALGRLLRGHTFAKSQQIPKASVSSFFTLLDRIPAFELHTGPDPVNLGKWIVKFCQTHWRQWAGAK
ncbi:MAG: hypothetical protein KJO34_03665 [Deltaproteobacteria bacterium]|nr:hypothetical protein [Deltaproteobacteria bacterium]